MNAGSLPGRVAVVGGGFTAAERLRIDYLGAAVLVITTSEPITNVYWHQNGIVRADKLRGIPSAGTITGEVYRA
jgi:hypothetical protein